MATLLLLARLSLLAVFLVAGVAKLADQSGSRQALVDFGVPERAAQPLGLLLPVGELAVAAALLPNATAWWGALGALVLLLLFVAAIGFNLAHGRQPDCHCFGQLHSAPAGWPTLARNGILALVAAFVVAAGRHDIGPSPLGWVAALSLTQQIAFVGGSLALALLSAQAWLLLQLVRQNARLLTRLDTLEAKLALPGGTAAEAPGPKAAPEPTAGLPIGAPAPAFSLRDLDGLSVTLDILRAGRKPVVLLFANPGCGPCLQLMPQVAQWQREQQDQVMLVVVSRDTAAANRDKLAAQGVMRVLLQRDREVALAYAVNATPSAVLVLPDGTIGSRAAVGADAIRDLMADVVASAANGQAPLLGSRSGDRVIHQNPKGTNGSNGNGRNGNGRNGMAPTVKPTAQLGERVPPHRLSDLDGATVDLSSVWGSRQTLLLFWNPSCGFCARMLDDLRAWEAAAVEGAPQLVMISTGTVEANRALGLRAPILLDPGFTVASSIGVGGTPSAVLVDAQGQLVSGVGVGAVAVLALAAPQPAPPSAS